MGVFIWMKAWVCHFFPGPNIVWGSFFLDPHSQVCDSPRKNVSQIHADFDLWRKHTPPAMEFDEMQQSTCSPFELHLTSSTQPLPLS